MYNLLDILCNSKCINDEIFVHKGHQFKAWAQRSTRKNLRKLQKKKWEGCKPNRFIGNYNELNRLQDIIQMN